MSLEPHKELAARARGAYAAAREQSERTGCTVQESLEHTLVSALDFILAATLRDASVDSLFDSGGGVDAGALVQWRALKALRLAKRAGALDGMSVYSDMKVQQLEAELKERGIEA